MENFFIYIFFCYFRTTTTRTTTTRTTTTKTTTVPSTTISSTPPQTSTNTPINDIPTPTPPSKLYLPVEPKKTYLPPFEENEIARELLPPPKPSVFVKDTAFQPTKKFRGPTYLPPTKPTAAPSSSERGGPTKSVPLAKRTFGSFTFGIPRYTFR